jgi:hypothetical protein
MDEGHIKLGEIQMDFKINPNLQNSVQKPSNK